MGRLLIPLTLLTCLLGGCRADLGRQLVTRAEPIPSIERETFSERLRAQWVEASFHPTVERHHLEQSTLDVLRDADPAALRRAQEVVSIMAPSRMDLLNEGIRPFVTIYCDPHCH